ncbi:hypothetical protein JTB14_012962 [Gonioctena quinquepunctata]|nr:hypothetical protein JTB14_012962 [Gonioctena quinquepunctata]
MDSADEASLTRQQSIQFFVASIVLVYKENVKKISRLIRDVDKTGLERAVWWTEYVIRNKGADHLKSPVADTPAYQFYLLDVYGVLIAIVFVIVCAVILVLKLLIRLLFGKKKEEKKGSKKNKKE